ncbi:hypothetical protein [Inquilinus sp. CAU 1745]|uniref:hypothetical protein n=1 Tax=Inquilinus sp. CAU 1745 TaxID=3140369 RepID=UPI00325A92FF
MALTFRRLAGVAIIAILPMTQASAQEATVGRDMGATREEAMEALRQLNSQARNPAAGECLPREEANADTLMKIHTELMQASLACTQSYADPTLYDQYQAFNARNEEMLTDAEERLTRYFNATEGGNGPALFDEYRTALANEESQFLNRYSTESYCRIRESRFNSLIDAEGDPLETYITTSAGMQLARDGCL